MTALTQSGAHPADDRTAYEPTLPPIATWFPAEVPCPDVPPPGPMLAPYLGLVSAVLCALGGGWLLLAPFALDFRQGAARTPRTTEVDLGTGAAVVALAIASGLLFAMSLARRLRGSDAIADEAVVDEAAEQESADCEEAADRDADRRETIAESDFEANRRPIRGAAEPSVHVTDAAAATATAGAAEPAPRSTPEPPAQPSADPANALRDLLTPLVAALAADLKSRSDQPEGSARP